jgi:predicted dehydrogenase
MRSGRQEIFAAMVKSAFGGAGVSRRGFMQSGAAAALGIHMMSEAVKQALSQERPWEQTSDKKVRIGVVGGGFGLAFHWNEHPNCLVEAVSDLLPDRREMLKGKYKCDKAYDSLEQLVLDPKVEAVALFTPAPDHARHVVLCMEHGKHVISACPACLTLDEAAQMKEAKERTGLRYMNAETSYYRWETMTARRLVREGALGELVYCEGEYYHPNIGRATDGLSMRNGERTWRYGYPPMLYPTHSTAFLVGVTGERLVKVSCIGAGDDNEPALKDNQYHNPFINGMALFQTDKGHPFRCNVCWGVHSHGERAQWFGTKGALYMPGWAGQPYMLNIEGQSTTTMPDYWHLVPPDMRYDSGHGASHPFITNEFVTALVEDREPAIDLYESLAYSVPGIIAHESALKGGEQLRVPSFDPDKSA